MKNRIIDSTAVLGCIAIALIASFTVGAALVPAEKSAGWNTEIVHVEGHEYVVIWAATGMGFTHNENCPNHQEND